MKIAGAILAAGASTRLGRRKQLELVGGESLLRRTARMALASRCARIAVVLGAFEPQISPALDGLDVDILVNPAWEEGMASSLRAAAAWANGDGLLVMVCDQTALETSHLDALIAAFDGATAVGSAYADTIGVPAVLPRSAFPALAALTGDRGARALLTGAASVPWEPGAIDLDT